MPEEHIGADDYNWAELMAVVISREVVDGEFGAVGAAADIPLAGERLAQLTHAPNFSFMCGAAGAINPTFVRLTESSSDYRNLVHSDFRYGMEDVCDLQSGLRLDFGFVGGIQIDKYGNVNLAMTGDWDNPTFRGPGSVGLVFTAALRRTYLFTEHHSKRNLVERVDFVSGPGWMDGGDSRSKVLRSESVGPRKLFTPLGVFDFPGPDHHARLISITPGYSVDDVRGATGFEVHEAPELAPTVAPTTEELTVLRTQVDRDGVLRRRPPISLQKNGEPAHAN